MACCTCSKSCWSVRLFIIHADCIHTTELGNHISRVMPMVVNPIYETGAIYEEIMDPSMYKSRAAYAEKEEGYVSISSPAGTSSTASGKCSLVRVVLQCLCTCTCWLGKEHIYISIWTLFQFTSWSIASEVWNWLQVVIGWVFTHHKQNVSYLAHVIGLNTWPPLIHCPTILECPGLDSHDSLVLYVGTLSTTFIDTGSGCLRRLALVWVLLMMWDAVGCFYMHTVLSLLATLVF
jgi:hypothetical protein